MHNKISQQPEVCYWKTKFVVGHLGIDGVGVGLEGGLVPARLHPAPVDGVKPGVDLHLAHTVPAGAAAKPHRHRLLEQALAQRPVARVKSSRLYLSQAGF